MLCYDLFEVARSCHRVGQESQPVVSRGLIAIFTPHRGTAHLPPVTDEVMGGQSITQVMGRRHASLPNLVAYQPDVLLVA